MYAVGQPHRIDAFSEALEYITGHDGVWVATGREIAEWYLEHHYDTAIDFAPNREALASAIKGIHAG